MTSNIYKIKWGEKESRYKKEKMIKEMEKGKKGKKSWRSVIVNVD